MSRWVAAALLLYLAPAAPAIKHKPPKEANDHPELVLVTATDSRTRKVIQATGTLIAPQAVLTVAHCVVGYDHWEVTAPYAQRRRVRVRRAAAHPHFKPGAYDNDLAVLILAEAIDTGKPLPALHGGALLRLETKLVVAGRVANGTVADDKVFLTTATLVENRYNANVYGGNPRVCEHGDSGGPVFAAGKEDEIVAVVSGGIGASRANVPADVYVPLGREEKDWILRQLPRKP